MIWQCWVLTPMIWQRNVCKQLAVHTHGRVCNPSVAMTIFAAHKNEF